MTFQPIVVGSGLVGWQFLQSTMTAQRNAFDKSPAIQRDADYFRENIESVTTAEQLVADRRMMRVALEAFGLQDDINNKFFIQKILEGGTLEQDALANRLADDRYREFSKAFGFGDFPVPNTKLSDFPDKIIDRYLTQRFEVGVGQQDETLRLALNASRSFAEVAQGSGANDTKWFQIMGTPPLRTVIETALGLPQGFGQLDIDQQLVVFKDRAEARFGTSDIGELSRDPVIDDVVQAFLLQSQTRAFQASSSGSIALTLLQSIPRVSLLG